MSGNKSTVRECRGSRFRCLGMTTGSREQVAKRLTDLAFPFATVEHGDNWMPRGLCEPDEAKLGTAADLLDANSRDLLTKWWLVKKQGANTPNWDIASTCKMKDGKRGLLLVEAKAHDKELNETDSCGAGEPNRTQIHNAVTEANAGLNEITPGWNLSIENKYQLSNRFAWAWKVASMGTPVILVYLGFLNADEMEDQGVPLADCSSWRSKVAYDYAKGVVPEEAWDNRLDVNGTPLFATTRAVECEWKVQTLEG